MKERGKPGTFKNQRQLQKLALDSQSKQRGPWLRGASTTRIAKVNAGLRTKPLQPGKQMKHFIDTTQSRVKAKAEVGLWRGFPLRRSALRRNKPLPQFSAPPRGPGAAAAVQLSPVRVTLDTLGLDKRRKYKTMTSIGLHNAKAFAVESVNDLSLGNGSTEKLLVWLHAIAEGRKIVEELNPNKTRQLLPAMASVDAKLHFTKLFRIKQARLYQVFTSLLGYGSGKRWKVVDTPQKETFEIKTAEDFRKFLLTVQRVPQGSMSFSSLCARARPPRVQG